MRRRYAVVAWMSTLLGILVAGCSEMVIGSADGPPAAAPVLRVGEQWVYRGREGYRAPVLWEETRTVATIDAQGIKVDVTLKGPSLDIARTELWRAPGQVAIGALMDIETRRFETPLQRYDFPLVPGKTWNEWVNDVNETTHRAGQINRYVRVGGWEKVSTPAGTFDALRLRVLMRLDDEEFWRGPTECNYLIWYSPAVGATVREEKNALYFEKGDRHDTGAIQAQHTVLELVRYTPG